MWPPMRLYVAEFKNGLVKVGVTSMADDLRIQYLRRTHGQIVRAHMGQPHQGRFGAERELIDRLRRIARTERGREWFSGVRFGTARQLVDQVTRNTHAFTAERKAA